MQESAGSTSIDRPTNALAQGSVPELAPHCVLCGTPLISFLGRAFHAVGIRRSSRNPHLCTRCNLHTEEGKVVEITVMFADLSGFTEMTRDLGPEKTHEVIDAFLRMTTTTIARHNGFVDKFMGDAVIALFNAPIRRDDHAVQAVAAAQEIHSGLAALRARFGLDLHASAGIARGFARVGRVGSSDSRDYTAIGDVVNLAARLEAQTRADETLVDEAVYTAVLTSTARVPREMLVLKGFAEAVPAYRLGATSVPPERTVNPEHRIFSRFGPGSIVFAILGAPCAAAVLIGPAAVALGLGSVIGIAGLIAVLDASPVRLPLLALALLSAFANLYTAWHARELRRRDRDSGRFSDITRQERRRGMVIVATSIITIAMVAFEMYAHGAIQGHAYP